MTLDPRSLLRAFGPAIGLIATWLLFAALAGRTFVMWSNFQLMLIQTAVVGAAAVGATWIIVSGGIDLSVGSTIALTTVVTALLINAGWDPTLAALGGVASAALIGVALGALVIGELGRVIAYIAAIGIGGALGRTHGVWIGVGSGAAIAIALGWLLPKLLGKVALSPFIVTLGLWGAVRGLAKGLSGATAVYPTQRGWLGDAMNLGPSGLFAVLPPGVCILIVLASVAAIAMRYTVFGRHVFAVGSNEEAARLCGVRVERVKLAVYVLGLACAGVAGVLQFAFLSVGDPITAQGYELQVIAAVVIGGASLSGGQGSIGGALIGAFIMTMVANGCTKLGLDNWVQELATGAIIVGAVALDGLRRRASR